MKKVLSVVIAVVLLLVAGHAMAETPESLDGVKLVNADWVNTNFTRVKIYDARQKGEYVESHIKGAISAPYREKSEKNIDFDESRDRWDINNYPNDKSTPIVVYCSGVKCWKSYKSLVGLAKEGYSELHWLREGFPGWQEKGYPIE